MLYVPWNAHGVGGTVCCWGCTQDNSPRIFWPGELTHVLESRKQKNKSSVCVLLCTDMPCSLVAPFP